MRTNSFLFQIAAMAWGSNCFAIYWRQQHIQTQQYGSINNPGHTIAINPRKILLLLLLIAYTLFFIFPQETFFPLDLQPHLFVLFFGITPPCAIATSALKQALCDFVILFSPLQFSLLSKFSLCTIDGVIIKLCVLEILWTDFKFRFEFHY